MLQLNLCFLVGLGVVPLLGNDAPKGEKTVFLSKLHASYQ